MFNVFILLESSPITLKCVSSIFLFFSILHFYDTVKLRIAFIYVKFIEGFFYTFDYHYERKRDSY